MISRRLILLAGLLFVSGITHAATGILELDSKPGGAEVFVDGKKKGTTPETEGQKLTMELAEGDHEIVIKKEGTGSATKTVFIGEGVIQPLTLTIMAEAFTNSLGMKFVPVPGTQILMCIHETRNRDYSAYATENRGVDGKWKNVVFDVRGKFTIEEPNDHPVVNVSWEEAKAFCHWLGQKEGKTYRLPMDHEWSCAAGIGDLENFRETPGDKSAKVAGFPWGSGYPPPKNNMGNYWDSTPVRKGLAESTALGEYSDGSLFTAAVMSYPANKLGIYDLGGNIEEWCHDLQDNDSRVLRGGSWHSQFDSTYFLSSYRSVVGGDGRETRGFRCVVVVGSSSP